VQERHWAKYEHRLNTFYDKATLGRSNVANSVQ
jgi:hypothetical protein